MQWVFLLAARRRFADVLLLWRFGQQEDLLRGLGCHQLSAVSGALLVMLYRKTTSAV